MNITEITKLEIDSLYDAILGFGKYINIDLKNKLPKISDICFLEKDEYQRFVLTHAKDVPVQSRGYSDLENKKIYIKILPDRKQFYTLKTLNHELIHLTSFYSREDKITGFSYIDSSKNKKFEIFEEGLTELTCWYIIKNFWKNLGLINGIELNKSEILLSYGNIVVLIDILIEKMSKNYNITYQNILHNLFKYHILNPLQGHKYILSLLGEELFEFTSCIPMEIVNNADLFVKYVKTLPLKEEWKIIQDGNGVYKFWDKI